ncbi:hypothetical protein ACWKSP_33740 [Micromonosporaceae bacterium Da 78-11]
MLIRELGAGVAALVVTAFAAPIISAGQNPAGRALLMAVATGMIAATVSDWRARIGVAATSVTIFIFLEPFPGATTGGATSWSFTPLIMVAAVLGGGYRFLAHESHSTDPNRPVDPAS